MSRKSARDAAMRMLYADALGGQSDEALVEEMMVDDPKISDDSLYIADVVTGVGRNLAQIDAKIDELSHEWTVDRMSKVDLSVLRLGVYEIVYRPDIPGGVTVNECVELAKTYSGLEAGSFVNGLLGNLLRSVEK